MFWSQSGYLKSLLLRGCGHCEVRGALCWLFYSIVVVGTLVFVVVAGKLEAVLVITVTSIAVTGAGMAQW